MEELAKRLEKVKETIEFEEKKNILRGLEAQSTHPDFWKDPQKFSVSTRPKKLSVKSQKEAGTHQGRLIIF